VPSDRIGIILRPRRSLTSRCVHALDELTTKHPRVSTSLGTLFILLRPRLSKTNSVDVGLRKTRYPVLVLRPVDARVYVPVYIRISDISIMSDVSKHRRPARLCFIGVFTSLLRLFCSLNTSHTGSPVECTFCF